MTTTTIAPSRVARTAAGREWPDVQRQYKLGRGVFAFSCAGHGGVIAVLGVADLPAEAVEAARAEGLIELVVFRPGEALYTSGEWSPRTPIYVRESLERWAADHSWASSFEVWVGEEDCAWSTIVVANDALREGGIRAGYFSASLTREDVERSCRDWHPDFFERFTGRTLTPEESSEVARRAWRLEHAGDFVTSSAWGDWHENVPEGWVGLSATRESDGAEGYFLVPKSEYDKREGSFVLDPDRHPPWTGPDMQRVPEEVAS